MRFPVSTGGSRTRLSEVVTGSCEEEWGMEDEDQEHAEEEVGQREKSSKTIPVAPKTMENKGFHLQKTGFLGSKNKVLGFGDSDVGKSID